MENSQPFDNLDKDILDSCIAASSNVSSIDFATKEKPTLSAENILHRIVKNNYEIIKDLDKKLLENKSLKILCSNFSHLILGNVEWNEINQKEAAKLLYGINFWIIKSGGPAVIDFVIKNDYDVDLVFLLILLFDEYV